jgi:choline dehydrogenase-like flavoprotein
MATPGERTTDALPCLAKAKSDSQTICIEPALAQYPNVALRTNARITNLETDPTGRSISKVVVDRLGRLEEYTADVIVLSAGAINSAALLLQCLPASSTQADSATHPGSSDAMSCCTTIRR